MILVDVVESSLPTDPACSSRAGPGRSLVDAEATSGVLGRYVARFKAWVGGRRVRKSPSYPKYAQHEPLGKCSAVLSLRRRRCNVNRMKYYSNNIRALQSHHSCSKMLYILSILLSLHIFSFTITRIDYDALAAVRLMSTWFKQRLRSKIGGSMKQPTRVTVMGWSVQHYTPDSVLYQTAKTQNSIFKYLFNKFKLIAIIYHTCCIYAVKKIQQLVKYDRTSQKEAINWKHYRYASRKKGLQADSNNETHPIDLTRINTNHGTKRSLNGQCALRNPGKVMQKLSRTKLTVVSRPQKTYKVLRPHELDQVDTIRNRVCDPWLNPRLEEAKDKIYRIPPPGTNKQLRITVFSIYRKRQ